MTLLDDLVLIEKKFAIDRKSLKKFDVASFNARPRQTEAFNKLDKSLRLTTVLPTAYGKTRIAIYGAEICRGNGKRFIIVAPLKALVSEHADINFSEFFNGLQISGDFAENKKKYQNPEIDGYFMTYEMLYQFLISKKKRKLLFEEMNIGIVIIDEAHLIADKSRGHKLETMYYLLEQFYPKIGILNLSATVGNAKDFADHFNTESVIADPSERPVPLEKHFFPQEKVFDSYQKESLACQNADFIIQKYKQTDNSKFPSMLFFCTSRKTTEAVTAYINTQYNKMGIFAKAHNAGFDKENRSEVENEYREHKIQIVVCTTTLAMGMNMPTDVVGLLQMSFWDWLKSEELLMDANIIIQIIGRAGRGNGLLPKGYAYLFYEESHDYEVKDIVNHPLIVKSQIPNHMEYSVLSWMVSGADVETVYDRVFVPKEEKDWEKLEQTKEWLTKFHFVNENGNATDLGYKVIWYAIEPKTALHFIELKKILSNVDKISYANLFALTLMNDEFASNIAVRQTKNDLIALDNASRFIHADEIMKLIKGNEHFEYCFRFFNQICKAFAMTYNTQLNNLYKFPKIPSSDNDLKTLKRASQRIINASQVILGKNWGFGKQLEVLNKGIQLTIPIFDKNMLDLMSINGLGVKFSQTLIHAGIDSIEKLKNCNPKEVSQTIAKLVENDPINNSSIRENRILSWKMEASTIEIPETAENDCPFVEPDSFDETFFAEN